MPMRSTVQYNPEPIDPILTLDEFLEKQRIFNRDELEWVEKEFYSLPKERDGEGFVYVYHS